MRAGRISRDQLYELVWSQPMQHLAQEVGVSDVGLAKTCRRHGIPLPPRGYWAKVQAGKAVYRPALPARDLGQNMHIEISGGLLDIARRHFGDTAEMADGPYEDIGIMADRFRKRLGKVAVPRDFAKAHREIRKLLDKDEIHRRKKLTERYYWYEPVFDEPFERRRLRFLNALFVANARVGGTCWIRGEKARDLSITIGDYSMGFTLDRPFKTDRRGNIRYEDSNRLCLRLTAHQPPEGLKTEWADQDGSKLEQRFSDIFVEMAICAEQLHRASIRRMIEWECQRKREAEEAERKRIEEARRREEERLAALAKARLDALHDDAAALQQADKIRAYVKLISERLEGSITRQRLTEWSRWALAEADRIDPVVSGRATETLLQFPLEDAETTVASGRQNTD